MYIHQIEAHRSADYCHTQYIYNYILKCVNFVYYLPKINLFVYLVDTYLRNNQHAYKCTKYGSRAGVRWTKGPRTLVRTDTGRTDAWKSGH